MNTPFDRKHPYARKLLIVGSTAVLCAACFTGCSNKNTPASTEPSINIIESTTPTVTTPPTTEAKRENVAVVKEQLNVRTSPSVESNIINQLDAGEEVEVLRVEPVNGVEWAYVKQGWIPTDLLDMSNVTITTTANAATPANPDATEPPATTAPPPTEAPEAAAGNYNGNTTTGNNTTGNNNTANVGKMGVVIASELNIRDKATTDGSKVVGGLKYGDRVTILESKDGWGKIDKGWISLDHVYQDGATGKNACKGIITASGLNIRSGPGTNYDSVASLNKYDRVNILNRLTIGDYTWGCTDKGWVRMDYVYVDGTATDEAVNGTIIADALTIRNGPGTKYESIGAYANGTDVTILVQFTIGDYTWGCTDKGWVRMDYVQLY